MPTVAEIIKHLQGYDKDSHIAAHIWCEEDVIGKARDAGKFITTEQVQEVLDNMDRHVDCEIGMTWDSITCELDELDLPDLCGETLDCLVCGGSLKPDGVADARIEFTEEPYICQDCGRGHYRVTTFRSQSNMVESDLIYLS